MLPIYYLDKGTDCADAQAFFPFFIFMFHVLADKSSGTLGLNLGLSLHLHPFFVYCEQWRLWRVSAFARTRLSPHCSRCDYYRNFVYCSDIDV